jgi:phosphoglucomutase
MAPLVGVKDRFDIALLATTPTPDEKDMLLNLSAEDITASELTGDRIQALLTNAPANGAAIELTSAGRRPDQ